MELPLRFNSSKDEQLSIESDKFLILAFLKRRITKDLQSPISDGSSSAKY